MCCIVILHASVLQCRVHWLLSYCYSIEDNSHCQVKTEVINKPGTNYTCLVVGGSILCVSNIHPKLNECNDHHEHLISCWLMLFGGYNDIVGIVHCKIHYCIIIVVSNYAPFDSGLYVS